MQVLIKLDTWEAPLDRQIKSFAKAGVSHRQIAAIFSLCE